MQAEADEMRDDVIRDAVDHHRRRSRAAACARAQAIDGPGGMRGHGDAERDTKSEPGELDFEKAFANQVMSE
jgi:hypothetical protein